MLDSFDLKDIKWLHELYFGSGTMSLGDAIVHNAIVHHFAKRVGTLYHPAHKLHFDTLTCLYKDHPNIVVLEEEEYQKMKAEKGNYLSAVYPGTSVWPIYVTGHKDVGTRLQINWERQIYEDLNILFSARYKEFYLPKFIPGSDELYDQLTAGETNYIVVSGYMKATNERVHINTDSWSEGLKVIQIHPNTTSNLLQYVKLFQNAKQIHVVPSAIFCLLDSINETLPGKLYLHNIRKDFLSQINCRWNHHCWIDVQYNGVLF
jgi:hypothetical protein